MSAILDKLLKFITYWWFRYLMVTELYIVEKWERVVMHIIMLMLFLMVWYFNGSVVLPLINQFMAPASMSANEESLPRRVY